MTTDTVTLEKFTVAQIAAAISTLTGEAVPPKSFNYNSKALGRLKALMEERGLSLRDVLAAAGIEAVTPAGEPLSGLGIEADVAAAEAGFAASRQLRKAKPRHREGTKQAKVIEMLRRPGGVTIDDVVAATNWARHTTRGFFSAALKKKLGMTIVSEKVASQRFYRIEE